MTGYDIIGDIHGQATKLLSLLDNLGYIYNGYSYYHPEGRKVVFLGDFIDRGNEEKKVIEIVRPMMDSENAYAVMGNHELNAISFHTYNNETGKPNRKHNEKNIRQHKYFLNEYPLGAYETNKVIDWFKTLPLFLELDDANFVHAYWGENYIEDLKGFLEEDNSLTKEGFKEYFNRGSKVNDAVERILKGPEFKLPKGLLAFDALDNSYETTRDKWWGKNIKTYFDAATDTISEEAKQYKIDPSIKDKFNVVIGNKKLFFGHYWFKGEPEPLQDNIACLDYSACVGDNPLIAYRLNDNEKQKELSTNNFVKGLTF